MVVDKREFITVVQRKFYLHVPSKESVWYSQNTPLTCASLQLSSIVAIVCAQCATVPCNKENCHEQKKFENRWFRISSMSLCCTGWVGMSCMNLCCTGWVGMSCMSLCCTLLVRISSTLSWCSQFVSHPVLIFFNCQDKKHAGLPSVLYCCEQSWNAVCSACCLLCLLLLSQFFGIPKCTVIKLIDSNFLQNEKCTLAYRVFILPNSCCLSLPTMCMASWVDYVNTVNEPAGSGSE